MVILLYSRVPGGPTIDQRAESYYNYCQIFNFILSADTPVDLELPNQVLPHIVTFL
jgi:translation initiation factor 3 subunit L